MRIVWSLALFLASAVASATMTLLPGSSPQDAPAGVPFPNQIAVRVTDANGVPQTGARVPFSVGFYDGPVMDANRFAYDCFPDAGWNCQAFTDSNGIAVLPGFYGPSAFRFVVRVAGLEVNLDARASNTTFKSSQDMWWAGSVENGWGMSVVQHGSQLFNVIYAYDAEGKPTWWVIPTGTWDGYHVSYAGNTYAPRSAPYFAYDSSRLTAGDPAGRVTLSFDGPDAATLGGTFGASTVQKRIVRMDFSSDASLDSHGVGDMWWGGESQNGWGVAIIERKGALFAVWLTYGADGKPTWFVMPGGSWTDGAHFSGPLLHTTGSPWAGAAYDASALKVAASGTYTLHFTDAHHATLEYSIEGRSGSLPLARQPF